MGKLTKIASIALFCALGASNIKTAEHRLITGVPGVGKTTEAKALAEKTNLPITHLDDIAREGNDPYAAVRNLLKQREPQIIEGSQLMDMDPSLFDGHDLRVLEAPIDEVVKRLVARGWRKANGEMQHSGRAAKGMTKHFMKRLEAFKRKIAADDEVYGAEAPPPMRLPVPIFPYLHRPRRKIASNIAHTYAGTTQREAVTRAHPGGRPVFNRHITAPTGEGDKPPWRGKYNRYARKAGAKVYTPEEPAAYVSGKSIHLSKGASYVTACHEFAHTMDGRKGRFDRYSRYEPEILAMVVENAAAMGTGKTTPRKLAEMREDTVQGEWVYRKMAEFLKLTGDPKTDLPKIKEFMSRVRDKNDVLGRMYDRWIATNAPVDKPKPAERESNSSPTIDTVPLPEEVPIDDPGPPPPDIEVGDPVEKTADDEEDFMNQRDKARFVLRCLSKLADFDNPLDPETFRATAREVADDRMRRKTAEMIDQPLKTLLQQKRNREEGEPKPKKERGRDRLSRTLSKSLSVDTTDIRNLARQLSD